MEKKPATTFTDIAPEEVMAAVDQNILPKDGTVYFFPGFFTKAESNLYNNLLLSG